MRDYGKVFSRIWESPDFRALDEDGRMLVLYLLTCQHGTIAGVFRVPDGYASEDLQWSPERVAQGFAKLAAQGFANRCETTKWVWVIKFLEWNAPENPNQGKAAAKVAMSVPDQCSWKRDFYRVNGPLLGLAPLAESQPLAKGSATVSESVSGAVAGTEAVAGTGDGAAASNGSGAAGAAETSTTHAAGAASTRGSRLARDWALPKGWGDWALAKYPHWTADIVRSIATQFRNHWVAKSGKDATKLDWQATWENWVDSGITQREHPPPKDAAAPAATSAKNAEAKRLLGIHAGQHQGEFHA